MRVFLTKRWIVGVLCVSTIVLGTPERAEACGSVEDGVRHYWSRDKHEALDWIGALCGQFTANKHEAPLLAVFFDAINQDVDKTLITRAFEAYWCLGGVSSDPRHKAVVAALPDEKCPTQEEVANWYVVSVDSVNIRLGPSVDAERFDGALRNTLVKKTGQSGEWFKIRRMGDYKDLYIHESLLAPYRTIATVEKTD